MQALQQFFGPIIPQWVRRKRRQMKRASKREEKHAAFHIAGLNGNRAMARRKRQIEQGQLRVSP